MPFSYQELADIVGRASTIDERLGPVLAAGELGTDAGVVEARLARWQQVAAKGNSERFARRLAWDALAEPIVRRALGPICLADRQSLPSWALTLNGLLHEAESTADPAQPEHFLNPQEAVPFEDVFAPFVIYARRQLLGRIGDGDLLSEQAQTQLERNLLERLADLCACTLELEFSVFRELRRPVLARWLATEPTGKSITLYREFAQGLLAGRLRSFFQEYAVLARLTAMMVNSWIDSMAEFLGRLAEDRLALAEMCGTDAVAGPVAGIRPFLGDMHAGGRAVIAVKFASGLRLVYKPRSVGLEHAYFGLLAWCNEREANLPFKALRVLVRPGYGWVEYVESSPCANEEEARRYFMRAGMLLCLVYVLKGTDFHFENLIACGEHPVLIDVETLLYPDPRSPQGQSNTSGQTDAEALLANSVLRTGLLPEWEGSPDGQVFDTGAFSGAGEQASSFRHPQWKHVNTDDMVLRYEVGSVVSLDNAPALSGTLLSPEKYRAEIEDGFSQMYRFLMRSQPTLLATDGPFVAFRHQRVRFIFRPTKIYALLLQRILKPELLRDGADRSIELDALSRMLLSEATPTHFWPLLRAELQSLERQDIPLFATSSDSDSLTISPVTVLEQFFTAPGFDLAVARLTHMSEHDLHHQVSLIRMCLYSRYSRFVGETGYFASHEGAAPIDHAPATLSRDELVEQALAIAVDLRKRAIRGSDGSATWIGLTYISAAQREPIRPLGFGLYDGSCGVALFLAALERIVGDRGFRELAVASLLPLRRQLQRSVHRHKLVREMGLGVAAGLGAILYSLVRIAAFLDEPTLLDEACETVRAISPEVIADDAKLDVLGGAAGAILGLLILYRATSDPAVLDRAWSCGQHLLNRQVTSPNGRRAWPTIEAGKFFTGFSHGAAGIAFSLLRLFEITREADFFNAAREGIAFEQSVFSPHEGNWPVSSTSGKEDGELQFVTAWCYGAPGIGLARLGGLPILDTAEVRQDIDIALRITQQVGLDGSDHLCCGNLGRLEFQLAAGRRLDRPELLQRAHEQVAGVIHRARLSGRFQLFDGLPDGLTHPGFFQGTAGIGYELLRFAFPDELPSVLLWA